MKKALIVGLNNYPGCELNWCDNDAIAMNSLIESNRDGSPQFIGQLLIKRAFLLVSGSNSVLQLQI